MVKGSDIKFAATISFQSGLTGVFVYKIDSGIHCNPGEHYQRCESSLVESETSNCKDKKYAYERYWNKTDYQQGIYKGLKKHGANKVYYRYHYEQQTYIQAIIPPETEKPVVSFI